ncbi:RNA polymerase sigma factor SigJ [Mycobacterium sp. AMU20-3851]|uniref:RNA polymerase sigma factor SigJ n=1 Tax=Mycobacterium sp. AMU20-3851 TaxID=3122055 RepID=UPI003754E8AE
MDDTDVTEADRVFAEHQSLLFTVAYQILGSAVDAEDVVQDSYLRWRHADTAAVEYPRAYLVQTVTRQAVNTLRATARRREDYVGNWLPEPILTGPDVSADALLAESVSMAMMLILQTLTPAERAVFVLGEVFGFAGPEIAAITGKTEVAVRQTIHRARRHVQARRKRFEPDRDKSEAIVDKFLRAARTGDMDGLLAVLSSDVIQISDGGGQVRAAQSPVVGPERVAHFIMHLAGGELGHSAIEFDFYNTAPAVLFSTNDRLHTVLLFEVTGSAVSGLYAIRNPEKLRAARVLRALAR